MCGALPTYISTYSPALLGRRDEHKVDAPGPFICKRNYRIRLRREQARIFSEDEAGPAASKGARGEMRRCKGKGMGDGESRKLGAGEEAAPKQTAQRKLRRIHSCRLARTPRATLRERRREPDNLLFFLLRTVRRKLGDQDERAESDKDDGREGNIIT